jgi:DNA-binding XRE family transcriptional regulator
MINRNKLAGRIIECGFNQRTLAAKIGMSKNTLNNKINGKSAFNTNEIEVICLILGITSSSDKADIFLAKSSQN